MPLLISIWRYFTNKNSHLPFEMNPLFYFVFFFFKFWRNDFWIHDSMTFFSYFWLVEYVWIFVISQKSDRHHIFIKIFHKYNEFSILHMSIRYDNFLWYKTKLLRKKDVSNYYSRKEKKYFTLYHNSYPGSWSGYVLPDFVLARENVDDSYVPIIRLWKKYE